MAIHMFNKGNYLNPFSFSGVKIVDVDSIKGKITCYTKSGAFLFYNVVDKIFIWTDNSDPNLEYEWTFENITESNLEKYMTFKNSFNPE